jgi:hypothetical protein
MNKVYVVRSSSGTCDDYHEWIEAIYTDQELANNLKDEINKETENIKNLPCPVDLDVFEELSIEEQDIYYEWLDKHEEAVNKHPTVVLEYPLNKRFF